MTELYKHIYEPIALLLAGLASGFATWVFSKKATKAELAKKETEVEALQAEVAKAKVDSSKRIMDLYQEALDDLKVRYEERYEFMNAEFERRHGDLKLNFEAKYEELKNEKDSEIIKLKKKVENLRQNLEYWKGKYEKLNK
jgi:hypothetical protein